MAIATTNPATGEVLKTFAPLTASEIEAKLALAAKTFSTFQNLSFAARGAMMLKAADLLEAEKEAIAKLMTWRWARPSSPPSTKPSNAPGPAATTLKKPKSS